MTPYKQGSKDFKEGQVVNPFNFDSFRGREWERGFNSAYFSNKKKVERGENYKSKSYIKDSGAGG